MDLAFSVTIPPRVAVWFMVTEGIPMRCVPSVIVVTVMLALPVAAQNAQKSDLDLMQGKWDVIRAVDNGESLPGEVLSRIKVTITQETMQVEVEGEKEAIAFKIDPSKKPKIIDLSPATGTRKGKTFPGIYQVTETDLKICGNENEMNSDRPKDFNADKGSGHSALFLRRAR
jgi:uncharacterized protein (TIGR03067 family)